MNVLLVRHGETAWNREGRYQGRTDIPLSPDGEAQVRALGLRLAHVPIAIAIASPLSRARRTAEAILTGRTTELEIDDGLREISHGGWEGKLATDIELSHAEMFRHLRPDFLGIPVWLPALYLATGPSFGQFARRVIRES